MNSVGIEAFACEVVGKGKQEAGKQQTRQDRRKQLV